MSQDEYFKLVQALAGDLNRDDIRLPSFPDVVIRIRTALDDPDTTGGDLADILSNDPALASRVLILANSTYYNPAGIKIESLGAAVGRIGFEKVRAAAIAYAIEQLYASEKLGALKNALRESWSQGTQVAAMSEVIARSCKKPDSDNAFIAGLLNGIGVLYIYTKLDKFPNLLSDEQARRSLIEEWSAPIGESIVANRNFSEDIQATLNSKEDETDEPRLDPNLADVVTAAKLSAAKQGDELYQSAAAMRLQLTDERMPGILEAYQKKLGSLASAVRS